MKATALVFAAVVVTFVFCITVSGQFHPLPGTFFEHDFFPQHKVFDISPNGATAITVRNDPTTPNSARLTTFDPILGTVFDNETFVSAGPREVRLAQVEGNLRAVAPGRQRERYTSSISVLQLCLKSPKSLLEEVSTTRSSGWVMIEFCQ